MAYTGTHMHEITTVVDSDIELYMCFSMSENHKDKILAHCRLIMGLLLRKYRQNVDQISIRSVDPIHGTNPHIEDKVYKLSIQMEINETSEDKPRIYFYFEVYKYGQSIDCSENYIDTRSDENNQVYVKEMTEILNGTRHHYVYNDSDDESQADADDNNV
jgi:hypothetical protein